MENFWDSSVWGSLNLIACLLLSLLLANTLKRKIKLLRASLIPTSVLGGAILLAISGLYKLFTGNIFFDTHFFGGHGMATLEIITYHCLALGFIASAFKTSDNKMTKQRGAEIFNTGVSTVATYLIQAVFGFGVTFIASLIIKEFFVAAGLLLPFGYGQGTGQALNYGNIYETQFGFVGGKSFGLTVAAFGFISAALGGVIHLNILKRKGKINWINSEESTDDALSAEDVQAKNEIPMQGSIDKMTIQIAFVLVAYLVSYFLMCGLGMLLPGMKSVIFGFNFLLGVLAATIIKTIVQWLRKTKLMGRQYLNNFLMTRTSNFFFDIMIVAGIAAIRLGIFQQYWAVLLIIGLGGALITYFYLGYVCRTLFPDYENEQFVAMYGMLTGTASTGIVLLIEIDGEFKTPVADNLVYQNFPAIVFGFPLMLLATMAPVKPLPTLVILAAFFVVMNIILFRSKIFKKKSDKTKV
ncbi:MAG: hypothetical protein IJW74_05240, partial [Oscillospiraceae bacterium]|nr:hypothetical protein [Oscillospiraceae bacterium]